MLNPRGLAFVNTKPYTLHQVDSAGGGRCCVRGAPGERRSARRTRGPSRPIALRQRKLRLTIRYYININIESVWCDAWAGGQRAGGGVACGGRRAPGGARGARKDARQRCQAGARTGWEPPSLKSHQRARRVDFLDSETATAPGLRMLRVQVHAVKQAHAQVRSLSF